MRREHDDFDLRPQLFDISQYGEAIHSRQAIIEDDYVRRFAFDHPQRLLARPGNRDSKAMPRQIIAHGARQNGFIVDDQDRVAHDLVLRARWKNHVESGSATRCLADVDGAAVSFDKLSSQRQSDSRSLRLRGKERLEDAFPVFGRNTTARILDRNIDRGRTAIAWNRPCADRNASPRRRRLKSVGDEAHKNLLHLISVQLRRRNVVSQIQFRSDLRVRKSGLENAHNIIQQSIHFDGAKSWLHRFGDIQQSLHPFLDAVHLLHDAFQGLFCFLLQGRTAALIRIELCNLSGGSNRRQRIADSVGNGTGHFAYFSHSLGSHQLGLHLQQVLLLLGNFLLRLAHNEDQREIQEQSAAQSAHKNNQSRFMDVPVNRIRSLVQLKDGEELRWILQNNRHVDLHRSFNSGPLEAFFAGRYRAHFSNDPAVFDRLPQLVIVRKFPADEPFVVGPQHD